MRICVPSCGVAPGSTSGGEVVERELALAWQRSGRTQAVLLPWHLEAPPELTVEWFKAYRGIRPWNAPLAFVPAILRSYRRRPFQILRAHSTRYTGLACLIAGRILKVPVVATYHHHDQRAERLTALDRMVLRLVDKVIAACAFASWQLLPLGIEADIVPWGVSDDYWPVRYHAPDPEWWWKKYGIANGPVVLTVCGLKPRKNVAGLLREWAEVARYHPTAVLAIAGEGPEMPALIELADKLALLRSRVRFLGRVSDAEKLDLYRNASLYTILPETEGFGMTVIEAMAAGCPVVTTPTGIAASELPDGRAVVRVVEHAAAGAILSLLNQPGELERARLVNPMSAARFTWDQTVEKMARAYERVLA
jgi:glycosyltransferase involved in cell wall biosynthesis